AIAHTGGSSIIAGSTFSANVADAPAAILAKTAGTLDVSASVFDGNIGAAIGVVQAQLTISGSTFFNNQSDGYGAIGVGSTTFTMTNSVVFSNTSTSGAGGIYLAGTAATLTNVTVSGNRAK